MLTRTQGIVTRSYEEELRFGRELTRRDPTARLALSTVIVGSSLVNLPRIFNVGPVTTLAFMSGAYISALLFAWLASPVAVGASARVAAVWAMFLLWAVGSTVAFGVNKFAVQNVLVIAIGLLGVLVGARCASVDARWRHGIVGRILQMSIAGACLYGIALATFGFGANQYLGPRGFALFALLGLGCALARFHAGRRMYGILALGFLMLIGASLSRLALGIGVTLVALSFVRPGMPRRLLSAMLIGVLCIGSFAVAITSFGPLRDRVFGGDQSIHIAGRALNTSGRTQLWSATLASWRESPWIGKGAGSSAELLRRRFSIDHPHNDYLRILHDYGLVGLLLFVLLLVALCVGVWRGFAQGQRGGAPPDGEQQLAALLSVAAFALGMATDNVLVYVFFVGPMSVLVGAALADRSVGVPKRIVRGGQL